MKKNGFIKLHRSFFEHDFWDKRREFSYAEAFLDLIQNANYAPKSVRIGSQKINLKVGEQVASLRYLGTRWGWSKGKVARFMDVLKTERMAGQRTEHGQTIIILCKYEDYNTGGNVGGTANGTADGTATGQQRDKTEEVKKVKNITLPFESEKFQEAWLDFVQHRKEKKSPLKPTSTKRALNKLAKMGEANAIAALDNSISNGWTGIFPPDKTTTKLDGKIKERGLWD